MYPKAYPATLIAELNDGRKFSAHVDYPKGDPENPTTREKALRKFHTLTEGYVDEEKKQRIIDTVDRID
jgi:2-methylcitrate dehydratase PrpD